MLKMTRRELQTMEREAFAIARFYELPLDLQADTPKVLSGDWYRSETIRKTAGKFNTPVFDTLAYLYTVAREARGEAPTDTI